MNNITAIENRYVFIDETADEIACYYEKYHLKDKNNIWYSRTSAFLVLLIRVLVYLRDKGELHLKPDVIDEYFELEKIINLVNRNDIQIEVKEELVNYLINLPKCHYIKLSDFYSINCCKGELNNEFLINDISQQDQETKDHHNITVKQLTKIKVVRKNILNF